jgi:hypothetical protein
MLNATPEMIDAIKGNSECFVTLPTIAFSNAKYGAAANTLAACRSPEDVDLWKKTWLACANDKSAQFRVAKSLLILQVLEKRIRRLK